jgi:hypothetical protein
VCRFGAPNLVGKQFELRLLLGAPVSTSIAVLALAGSMKDTLRNAIFALQSKKA